MARQLWRCLNRLLTIATPRSSLSRPALVSPPQVPSFWRQPGELPFSFFLQEILAESGLSANQLNDNSQLSSHPSGQTATDSFRPSGQKQSFLRSVLNKRSGNHGDRSATDGLGERSDPKASTPSVFGKIPSPCIECPSLGPTENWKPYGPVKAAMKKSITTSVSEVMVKEALRCGLKTDKLTSLADQLADHRKDLVDADETLKSLLGGNDE